MSTKPVSESYSNIVRAQVCTIKNWIGKYQVELIAVTGMALTIALLIALPIVDPWIASIATTRGQTLLLTISYTLLTCVPLYTSLFWLAVNESNNQ